MEKPVVNILKIGGKLLEDEQQLQKLLIAFLNLDTAKILIHGGGKKATTVLRQMDILPKMINGRRITDAETLEVVVMVYAGLLNKKLVSLIQSLGGNAIGLSGADGNVIQAHKRIVKDIDYGFAGDIDEVNSQLIKHLLDFNLIPVFCAVTHDKKGQLLNTNADTIASNVATALSSNYQVIFNYCLEKDGVLSDPEDNESVIPALSHAAYQAGVKSGAIYEGMIPKLDNAFRALDQGVSTIRICGVDSFIAQKGTILV